MIAHFHKLAYFVLVFGLLLHACTSTDDKKCETKPVPLKVALWPYISHLPLVIGKEEGYFEEEGLEVKLVQLDFKNIVPALSQGQLDVSTGLTSVSVLNAIARGAKIKFVADKGYIDPLGCASNALMARSELVDGGELQNPAQLRGRRMTIIPSTIEGYYVEKLLKSAGLSLGDVEVLDIPTPADFDALKKGRIDLTTASEPWVTIISEDEDCVLWMAAQEVIPDFQLAFILYGPNILDKNPDAGKRFMVAYLKAVRQYNRGKTERNLQFLTEFTELDQEVLKKACWIPIRSDGQINVESVLDFQAWALEKGYLDKSVTEDQFWDSSFIQYANQVLNKKLDNPN